MTESRLTDSQRVVVTGLGATTPLGGDVASTWEAMLAGRSGVKVLTQDWVDMLPVQIAAPVAVDPSEVLPRADHQALRPVRPVRADRRARGLGATPARPRSTPSGSASWSPPASAASRPCSMPTTSSRRSGARRVLPITVPMLMPNGPAALVGLDLVARAGVHTPVSACASGAEAIALRHRHDPQPAGRTSWRPAAPRRRSTCCRCPASRRCGPCRPATTSRSARPGPTTRAGTASCSARAPASWCSRPLEHALARGATVYGEIAGSGITSDAHHIAQPDPVGAGATRAMQMALARRGRLGVRGRAHQRARHLHAGRRRRRGGGHRERARRRG